jgi:cysteine-rich repeat protein
MRNLRVQGGLLAATGCLVMAGAGACSTPDLNTNLRPAGDPEVLSVLVMNDADAYLRESATYCADDDKSPQIVGLPDFTTKKVCGEGPGGAIVPFDDENGAAAPAPATGPIANGVPDGWFVRIMFDELLDPDVETLVETAPDSGIFEGHINTTQPVILECDGAEVDYDGFYVPNGNNVTWPLGPSLVVFPTDYTSVATSSACTIEIKDNVVDKDGNPVPAAQRGPFDFGIGSLEPFGASPSEGTIDEEAPGVLFTFNQVVDGASLDPDTEVEVLEDDVAVPAAVTADGVDFIVGPAAGFLPDSVYVISILADAEVADVAGGTFTFADPLATDELTATANCGNGEIHTSEDCDDGNGAGGDGCTGCTVDEGFDCTGEPSVCTEL